mgnify:CR=1 FL=1
MGIIQLLIYFAIAGLLLTLITRYITKQHGTWLMSFLQHFAGVWFLVSGFVKAVDPLGTAYKMEQYFAEFESTFQHTWVSFITPMFPLLGKYSISFSVFMIIIEMVLGILLITGGWKKFTGWLFLIIVVFFTILTGFTFLTGYVPEGANFFQFSKWVAYDATRMKVTDCGCFGDFLKLEPKVSFMKDLFLLIPSVLFIIRRSQMHTLINDKFTKWYVGGITALLLFYCLQNFYFDIPTIDFRPFKEGVNVRETKLAEEKAASEVQITAYKLKNLKDGKIVEIPNAQYLAEMTKYPKEEWEVVDQVKSELAVPHTKISEFSFNNTEGEDIAESLLAEKSYSIMISAYKLGIKEINEKTVEVPDSIFSADTIRVGKDSIAVVKRFEKIEMKKTDQRSFVWDEDYLNIYKNIIVPFVKEAEKNGIKCYMVCNSYPDAIKDFRKQTGFDADIYTGDDLLIKTIIRSNPGITLWKYGIILKHFHYKKLPEFNQFKQAYIK